MKIVITAGGTAGHINPAIALAKKLKSEGYDVIFAGTPNRLESKLVPQEGFEFVSFKTSGFNRKKPLTLISSGLSILSATKEAKKWLKAQGADCVVGFGCYVSIAICRAAYKLHIPFVIHEQNSVMGMANKYLSPKANAVCLAYKHADNGKNKNVFITGNPVRPEIFIASRGDGRKMLNIPDDAFVLLVFGGSLGANKLNSAIVDMAQDLLDKPNLHIVHITGEKQFDEVCGHMEDKKIDKSRYHILPYQNKMAETLAATDVNISRAGASTIAEITALSLPSILIPYPYATENHQYYNAQELVNAGCVIRINDADVESEKFKNAVLQLLDDEVMRINMKKAFDKFDAKNSVNKLSQIVTDSVRR